MSRITSLTKEKHQSGYKKSEGPGPRSRLAGSLHRPHDAGGQIALSVRRQVASWKGPRVGEYRRAPRLRTLKQPEGCGPSAFHTVSKGRGPNRPAISPRSLSSYAPRWFPLPGAILPPTCCSRPGPGFPRNARRLNRVATGGRRSWCSFRYRVSSVRR